jgi:hypothetical protein
LIYGEVRGNSELAPQIYGEKRYFPMHEKFVNVVQHLRDFGRFEMNKRDLGRQQEYHILIAEEEIHHTKTSGFTFDVSFYSFTQNHSLFILLFKRLLFSE